ncbi:DUF3298 domain-containing protein [Psychroserpens sp.]|uniref:DUF3298 and DUF4163 domain-containing protein n=1 Tax=Psychroserpens sp. TaxID=2020870 RepID=UPI003CC6C118
MKKTSLILILLITFFSCKKEVELEFTEQQIETSKDAEIAINIPKAEGNKAIADRINTIINNYIASQMNLSDDSSTVLSIDDAIRQFNTDYIKFKSDFLDSEMKWEVLIDGEVTHRSPEIICIAISSYLDTGGAHGNTNVRFFNFNPETGALYKNIELVNTNKQFSEVIQKKLNAKLQTASDNEPMEDMFFGKDFQLPETLGYDDEGLIILYNPYEIASYSQGIIEFTIPYDVVNDFLKIR